MRQYDYDIVDSTNSLAIRLVRAHTATPPFVVHATTQTAGRGRNGRAWASPRGGLWFSLTWPAAEPLTQYERLPLIAGAALAETLEHRLSLNCTLKWPNDVLIRQRKVAGVLCQMELVPVPFVIIGIGLNANFSTTRLPRDLRLPATTLQDELGHAVDMPALLAQLIDTLESNLAQLPRRANPQARVCNAGAYAGSPSIAASRRKPSTSKPTSVASENPTARSAPV